MPNPKKDKRFLLKKEGGGYPLSTYVPVDKKTGVNYLYASAGYGGGLAVMVDSDGKPIVTPVTEEE